MVLFTCTAQYVHGPTGIHAMQDAAGDWRWTVQDALGSVRGEADVSLAMQASRSYAPYGEALGEQGGFASSFGFTGEPVDANGLVHLRTRFYQPEMGRFLNQDLSWLEENLYEYGLGNPVNNIDPSGQQTTVLIVVGLGIFLLIAGVAAVAVTNPEAVATLQDALGEIGEGCDIRVSPHEDWRSLPNILEPDPDPQKEMLLVLLAIGAVEAYRLLHQLEDRVLPLPLPQPAPKPIPPKEDLQPKQEDDEYIYRGTYFSDTGSPDDVALYRVDDWHGGLSFFDKPLVGRTNIVYDESVLENTGFEIVHDGFPEHHVTVWYRIKSVWDDWFYWESKRLPYSDINPASPPRNVSGVPHAMSTLLWQLRLSIRRF